MKKRIVLILMFVVCLFNAQAAFVIKNIKSDNHAVVSSNKDDSITEKEVSSEEVSESKVSKPTKVAEKDNGSYISKGLYVVLSILGLGWVAILVNGNVKGKVSWVPAIIFTLIGAIPGMVYSLLSMKYYYGKKKS